MHQNDSAENDNSHSVCQTQTGHESKETIPRIFTGWMCTGRNGYYL